MHKNNKPILLKNIRVIDASQNLDQEMNITVKMESFHILKIVKKYSI